jgi:RsiW-degrading membrane proteinase PrsW (M82 family)
MTVISLVALIIATVIPLIALYFIYTRDLYSTGSFRYIILSFLWGGVAFSLASAINTAVVNGGILSRLEVVQFSAPIAEEILKALILVYLVRRREFTYFVDGAIYGFAIGIGFAIFENYQYIFGNLGAALSVAIGRVISTNLIHATASSMVGISVGLARFERFTGRARLLILGLSLAMALHVGFNNLVTRVTSGLLLLYAAVIGFAGLGLIALAIRRGLADEKLWIEEKLGEADRVTAGEAAVVNRLEDVEKILEPLAVIFGQEKAEYIEKFLLMQARLGILRKTLDKLQDEKLIQGVHAEMKELQVEMDSARRSVGTYTMMYLRSIFPEHDSPLWGGLENVIDDYAANRPSGTSSMWANLERETTRVRPSEIAEDPPAIN